jgi:hypothetical protein
MVPVKLYQDKASNAESRLLQYNGTVCRTITEQFRMWPLFEEGAVITMDKLQGGEN